MRSLTIKQPWADCIIFGTKRIENRSWTPSRNFKGEMIAIHAGLSLDDSAFDVLTKRNLNPPNHRNSQKTGSIIGVATIVDCVQHSDSVWFDGPYGWILDDVRALEVPVPCKGKQGLWYLSDVLEEKVLRQLAGN